MDPKLVYTHIGNQIKSRRKQLGLTQERLAAQLGISRGSLANVETGRQNILVHQLYRYATELSLAPNDLLPQSSDPTSPGSSEKLPMPSGLKPHEKEQIVRLLGGMSETTPRKDETNDKQTKRQSSK